MNQHEAIYNLSVPLQGLFACFDAENSDMLFHYEVPLLEPLRVSHTGQYRYRSLESSALGNTAGTKTFRRGILDAYHHFAHRASAGEVTLLIRKQQN